MQLILHEGRSPVDSVRICKPDLCCFPFLELGKVWFEMKSSQEAGLKRTFLGLILPRGRVGTRKLIKKGNSFL